MRTHSVPSCGLQEPTYYPIMWTYRTHILFYHVDLTLAMATNIGHGEYQDRVVFSLRRGIKPETL